LLESFSQPKDFACSAFMTLYLQCRVLGPWDAWLVQDCFSLMSLANNLGSHLKNSLRQLYWRYQNTSIADSYLINPANKHNRL